MKLLTAIIRQSKLADVVQALHAHEVEGYTLTEVKGHGEAVAPEEVYRGARGSRELIERIKLEIALPESSVESVAEAILEAARTGEVGDGRLFVAPLEGVYQIRTGEVMAPAAASS
ncbi:MAG: DUF3240 domain-containing protein [Bacteroidetes bacterium]|jgi:nitrogen regulatory protein P-II 1|nr:DUF3240 domain-containing protein [Bacteroidota bacterium]